MLSCGVRQRLKLFGIDTDGNGPYVCAMGIGSEICRVFVCHRNDSIECVAHRDFIVQHRHPPGKHPQLFDRIYGLLKRVVGICRIRFMDRKNRENTGTFVLRHLQVLALNGVNLVHSDDVIDGFVHRRRPELPCHKRREWKPMRTEIRNTLYYRNGFTKRFHRLNGLALLFIFHKWEDVHGVSLRQNSYVVEHANAATVDMQNRRIRRHHQNMHFL